MTMILDDRTGLYVPSDLKASAEQVTGLHAPLMGEGGVRQPGKLRPEQLLKMFVDWVYGCVSKNAEGVSRTRLRLYYARQSRASKTLFKTKAVSKKRGAELEDRDHLSGWTRKAVDIEEVVDDHPFYALWDKGNPHLTGSQQKRMLVQHLDLVGDFFTFIKMEGGIPEYLITLPPAKTKVVTTDDVLQLIKGYIVERGAKGDLELDAEEVMHCKHPDPTNVLYGYSPLEAVGLSAGVYHEMTEFDNALLENGAIPSLMGVAKEGISESERKRAEAQFNSRFRKRMTGSFGIVSGDMDFKQFGFSQRDMQTRDNRQLYREELAAAFGVPMAIMQTRDVNKADAKEAQYQHAAGAIRPRCILIEDQINRDIMPLYDQDLFVAFDNPVPKDHEYELQREDIYLKNGVYTPNRVLEAHNEELREDGDLPRDAYAIAERQAEINAQAAADRESRVQDRPEPPESPPPPGAATAAPPVRGNKHLRAADPSLEATVTQWAFEVQRDVMPGIRAAKQAEEDEGETPESKVDPFNRDKWTLLLAVAAAPFLGLRFQEASEEAVEDLSRRVGQPVILDISASEAAQQYLAREPMKFARRVSETLDLQLRDVIGTGLRESQTTGEISRRVAGLFDEWRGYKSAQIARTEEARAASRGSLESWRASGLVEAVEWLCASDACDFCLELQAQHPVVPIGDAFMPEGSEITLTDGRSMALDYSDILHPPVHPNCRCDIIPVLVEVEAVA